jgi:hypothetical protein
MAGIVEGGEVSGPVSSLIVAGGGGGAGTKPGLQSIAFDPNGQNGVGRCPCFPQQTLRRPPNSCARARSHRTGQKDVGAGGFRGAAGQSCEPYGVGGRVGTSRVVSALVKGRCGRALRAWTRVEREQRPLRGGVTVRQEAEAASKYASLPPPTHRNAPTRSSQ